MSMPTVAFDSDAHARVALAFRGNHMGECESVDLTMMRRVGVSRLVCERVRKTYTNVRGMRHLKIKVH